MSINKKVVPVTVVINLLIFLSRCHDQQTAKGCFAVFESSCHLLLLSNRSEIEVV